MYKYHGFFSTLNDDDDEYFLLPGEGPVRMLDINFLILLNIFVMFVGIAWDG